MSLAELCVRRPVFAVMLVTFVVTLGVFSFRDLGVDLFPKADPATVKRIEAMILHTPVAGYEGCGRAIQGLDYFRDLGRMRVPTLYVTGEFDAGAMPPVMQAMAEATPGARLAVVPGSHHLPNIDNEKAFEAAIAAFVGLR